jgi:hypothetical protein
MDYNVNSTLNLRNHCITASTRSIQSTYTNRQSIPKDGSVSRITYKRVLRRLRPWYIADQFVVGPGTKQKIHKLDLKQDRQTSRSEWGSKRSSKQPVKQPDSIMCKKTGRQACMRTLPGRQIDIHFHSRKKSVQWVTQVCRQSVRQP